MGTTVRLTRSGCLAGLDMVASVDLDELPADTASQVRAALAGLEAGKPPTRSPGGRSRGGPAPPGPPLGADRYQYDLVVVGDGTRRSVTAHDGSLTPALQTLVDALLPFARPE